MTPRARRNIQRGSRCVRGVSAGASGPSSHSAACEMRSSIWRSQADYIAQTKSLLVCAIAKAEGRRDVPYRAIPQAGFCSIVKPAGTWNLWRRNDAETNFNSDNMRTTSYGLAEYGTGAGQQPGQRQRPQQAGAV